MYNIQGQLALNTAEQKQLRSRFGNALVKAPAEATGTERDTRARYTMTDLHHAALQQ
jgi:hypothetical protein